MTHSSSAPSATFVHSVASVETGFADEDLKRGGKLGAGVGRGVLSEHPHRQELMYLTKAHIKKLEGVRCICASVKVLPASEVCTGP